MTVSLKCECGKVLSAPTSMLGKKAKCPSCHKVLIVAERSKSAQDISWPPGVIQGAVVDPEAIASRSHDSAERRSDLPINVPSKPIVVPAHALPAIPSPIAILPHVPPELRPQTIAALTEILRLNQAIAMASRQKNPILWPTIAAIVGGFFVSGVPPAVIVAIFGPQNEPNIFIGLLAMFFLAGGAVAVFLCCRRLLISRATAAELKALAAIDNLIITIQSNVPSYAALDDSRAKLMDRHFIVQARNDLEGFPSGTPMNCFLAPTNSRIVFWATPFEFCAVTASLSHIEIFSFAIPVILIPLLVLIYPPFACCPGPYFFVGLGVAVAHLFVGIPHRTRAWNAWLAADSEALRKNWMAVKYFRNESVKVSFRPETSMLLIKIGWWWARYVATSHEEAARFAAFAQFCSQYTNRATHQSRR